MNSGVVPSRLAVFTLAPAFRSNPTSAALPFVHARDNGVMRKSFATFASAPARTSRSATARSFRCAAHNSAVEPEPYGYFSAHTSDGPDRREAADGGGAPLRCLCARAERVDDNIGASHGSH